MDNGHLHACIKQVRAMHLVSSKDIKNMDIQLAWVVENMMVEGSLNMLTGCPGSGKTWIALALANSIAKGSKFLYYPCKQMEVIFMDFESSLPILRDRLRRFDADNIMFYPTWTASKDLTLFSYELTKICKRKAFVIIDSFIRTHHADENSTEEMSQVMSRLRWLSRKGATIFVIHHRGKSEQAYRGSSDILAGVDVMYELYRDGSLMKLSTVKSRITEPYTIPIKLEIMSSSVRLQPCIQKTPQQLVEEAIRELGSPCQHDIIKHLQGVLTARDVRRILSYGGNWTVSRGDRNKIVYRSLR